MRVNGREINFLRTVSATIEVANMCKDGDIKNAESLFDGNYQDSQISAAKFIAVLSTGYEDNKAFREPGYKKNPITEQEVLSLTDEQFNELFSEAIKAYAGEKETIETEPVKKKNRRNNAK